MKRSWDLKPNLLDCILEERIAPAIANLGVIVVTTSGLSLVTPFPGASNNASGAGGTQTTAASVSGAAMPTSFYITGNRGISSFMPGNFTGNPSVGGAVVGSTGVGLTIQVGSGADQAGGPSSAASSSRMNPGSDGASAPIMAYIGSVSSGSGSSSASMSSQGGTQQQSAPVPSLAPTGVAIPGSPTGTSPGAGQQMNQQFGAPRLLRGLGSSLTPALPGGLGVGSLTSPSGPGGGY
jgi:hypothetical protein